MPFFRYEGQFANGAAANGTLEAPSLEDAQRKLAALEIAAAQVEEVKPETPRARMGVDDFIFFNEQLASMAASGMVLDEGLRQLAKDVDSPRLRHAIEGMADDARAGVPLDQALSRHEGRLPVLYGRVVRAGIETGKLPAVLFNLSHHMRVVQETKRILVETLAYPFTVLLMAMAIICFLFLAMIPSFETIFADFDTSLPWSTLMIISISRYMPAALTVGGVVLAALVIAWLLFRWHPVTRAAQEWFVLRVPLVGKVFRASLVSRFCRAVALSVSSGIPLPSAMRLASGATGSRVLDSEAERLAVCIEQGGTSALGDLKTSIIPKLFGYVVSVSTTRDALPEALAQLAVAYDQRASHSQAMVRGWLVPFSLIFVAGVIGFCILSLFLPLVALIESVSSGI